MTRAVAISVLFLQLLGHLLGIFASDAVILDINQGWNAVNSNRSVSVSASVPGSIFTDLQNNGLLGDPYYRFNDVQYRWVAYDNWTFTTAIQVPDEILSKKDVFLVAHGLDTVASIFLNGHHLADTSNMFVRSRWSVKEYIKTDSSNNLTIKFTSPVTYALAQHNAYYTNYGYDVPPACPSDVQNGECHVNFIRKMQSSFSWDWGPAFPTMGIWRPIQLEAMDSCVIRDVGTSTLKGETGWSLDLDLYLDCATAEPQSASITFNLSTTPFWSETTVENFTPDSLGHAHIKLTRKLPQDVHVDLWWPAGHGDQVLYDLQATFSSKDSEEMSTKTKRIGFRTVALIQDSLTDAEGYTFYVEVNELPVFLKGSNWIPADSFTERVTEDYLRNLLKSAVDANMNGMRVWGGGIYEQDVFYDIADELGILIWQDMMYACAMYPVDPSYIGSVKTEVTQQIRRLKSHPSVLLWSGNNENEAALAQNWYNTWSNYEQYKQDYIKLYVDTIMQIVQEEDPSRPFVVSSPSNGRKSEEDGYVAKNPYDAKYGDVHYYQYILNAWDSSIYPRPRFASEYGFQSWPSFETLSKVSIAEDWNYSSPFMEHRQHHLFGNLEIEAGIKLHMHFPTGCSSTVRWTRRGLAKAAQFLIQKLMPNEGNCESLDGFKGILYLSQIYQAVAVKTETESYRRAMSSINSISEGLTMGALYWQLNDIWQGASWSSIEYGGKWKMLHYFAKNFFAPILVSPYIQNGLLVVFVANDGNSSISGAHLHIDVFRWNNFSPVLTKDVVITIEPTSAVKVYNESAYDLFTEASCEIEECFFYFNMTDANNQLIGPTNFIFPTPLYNAIDLKKAQTEVKSIVNLDDEQSDCGTRFEITVTSDNIAPFVWLEASGIKGRFSDNGFLMVNDTVCVEFCAWQNVTAQQLSVTLTVMSLMDLY